MRDGNCSVDGCGATRIKARGYCSKHYSRWRRHGPDGVHRDSNRGLPGAFIRTAIQCESDDCLIWPFYRNNRGYGKISIGGKSRFAHRIVCRLAHGDPEGKCNEVSHLCHKGHQGCVNPRHLEWATHHQNVTESVKAHRYRRGGRHGMAKLMESEVIEIKRRLTNGQPNKDIARDFKVSPVTISDIKTGRRWSWLKSSKQQSLPLP